MLNNYLDKENALIQKRINRYEILIFKLKKIDSINKKLAKYHIPVLSHATAQLLILNTLDDLSKKYKIRVENYEDENDTIKVDFFVFKELKYLKDKKRIKRIFEGFFPINTVYKDFVYQNHKVLAHLNFILLYKAQNDKR
jgi:putative ribosome biogenesis GTPase RsgA